MSPASNRVKMSKVDTKTIQNVQYESKQMVDKGYGNDTTNRVLPQANRSSYLLSEGLLVGSNSDVRPLNGSQNQMGAGGMESAPMFDRLVTDDLQELKAYSTIVDRLSQRVIDLERVHGDLESRLQAEARARRQLENVLEERESMWVEKFETLKKDRDHWKDAVHVEQTKNERLFDQVLRKDQDIHRMLQRKYDHPRDGVSRSLRSHEKSSLSGPSRSPEAQKRTENQPLSPHEIVLASGSMEDVRLRNVSNTLKDFFYL